MTDVFEDFGPDHFGCADESPANATPNLGPCCGCGASEGVRSVMMLDRRGPTPGRGWGCLVCNLPADGAIAVLCDRCVVEDKPIRFVCRGYSATDGRIPVEGFRNEPFHHDEAAHRAEAA
jgi:hypothetical protein